MPLETLESAFLLQKLYNGCLEIIIWQKKTNYLSKGRGRLPLTRSTKFGLKVLLLLCLEKHSGVELSVGMT
jgi:hypothetical protein